MKTQIITHRGLDPSRKNYFAESSREAFLDQLARGYGLEFDVQFTDDDGMIAVHDPNLKRISKGEDNREISSISTGELLGMEFNGCHLATVDEVLSLIDKSRGDRVSALHLKAAWQEPIYIDRLLDVLKCHDLGRFFVFDVMVGPARYLKRRLPELKLGTSISHPYDIKRYKQVTGGTLLSLEEAQVLKGVVDWAWLDEWDRTDENGGDKTFCNAEVFTACRDMGLKIALVTPEMHATSPGLLGGEAHQDARDHDAWEKRMREIISLQPDAVCTDFPDEVMEMIG